MSATEFAARLRRRERLLGYWSVMDCPVATEWLAHVGWDYIALDLQHGLIGYSGMVAGLTAIDAAGGAGRAGARGGQRPDAHRARTGRGRGRGDRAAGQHRRRGRREPSPRRRTRRPASGRTGPCARSCGSGRYPRPRRPRHRRAGHDRDAAGSGQRRGDLPRSPDSTASTSGRPTCASPSAARTPRIPPSTTSSKLR